MASLPAATLSIDDAGAAQATGTELLVVMAPVATHADSVPRLFGSSKALLDYHGYSQGCDYAALHMQETKKPVLFCGLPIGTAGVISQQDDSQVDGTSAITVTGTPLEECDLEMVVVKGGDVGTDPIVIDLSLDGGRTWKTINLGTATSYAIPYVGLTLNFATGDLDVDDVYTCRSSAPIADQAGIQAAREALAAQLRQSYRWLVIGDVATDTAAGYVVTEANAYETSNDRFVTARIQVRDQYPAAKMSNVGTTTFAEVGLTGDTITRSAGSWVADGFKVGDVITVAGSASNNFADGDVTGVTPTVLTLGDRDLVAEGPVAAGTLTITAAAESKTDWDTDTDAEFSDIDDEKRIDIARGRGRKVSPVTGWMFRRPVAWAASIREYQHDVQIPCWRKADGPCSGWDLEDEDGTIVEYDARTDAGPGRFTCFRTYGNGPNGAFIAMALTRADENSLLSRTHNMAVTNVACTVCQAETENAIGEVLVLNADGTGSEASLTLIESRVNTALGIAVLQAGKEGPRASSCKWTASREDVLNVPGATLTGSMDLLLNGTLERIETRARVQTAG